MSTETNEDAIYALLMDLAGVDTYDVNLRDHPDAWKAVEKFIAALSTPPAAVQPAAPPEFPGMPQYWSVGVEVDGESLVSIGFNWLSGKAGLTDDDEKAILGAAQHLLSFIGYGLPPSSFDPDDGESETPTPCAGTACGTTTAQHSRECIAEHAAAVAGGRFVKLDKETGGL
jgi:hypothetical protein